MNFRTEKKIVRTGQLGIGDDALEPKIEKYESWCGKHKHNDCISLGLNTF